MGFASHLGPWRLGTVKDTTGTTIGTVENMGCTAVTQSVPLVASTAVTLVLPAGSLVHDIKSYMTTGANAAPAVTIGGVEVGTVSTNAGQNTMIANATNVTTLINVGTTDKFLSFTTGANTAGILSVLYTVRASDGSEAPTAQQN